MKKNWDRSKRIFHKKIKKHNGLLTDSAIIGFLILFSLTYFYLDPSITGYGTLENNDALFKIQIADVLNLTLISPLNNTKLEKRSIILNVTQEGNITNFIIFII